MSKETDKIGWLVNEERKERRDNPHTLTNGQVEDLIQKIENHPEYTKLKNAVRQDGTIVTNRENYDRLIQLRDQALISLSWIFFKRVSENLRLKLKNVTVTNKELSVTFRISKKAKRIKKCPHCETKNSLKAKFCKQCGKDISEAEVVVKGETSFISAKQKTMKSYFSQKFVEWIKVLKEELKCDRDAYVFPPYNYWRNGFLFQKHITRQRVNQILQRLDPTLTSHMFRYGAAEKYLRAGYTPQELKKIGDWASSAMPEEYADRKGLTPEEIKFRDDPR